LLGGAGLAAGALRSPALAAAVPAAGLARQLGAAATAAIAAGACPGVQLALACRGRVVVSQAHGFANLETRTVVGLASVFRIGSLTKQFTAAAVIKLSEMGRLALDAPASKYLPFLEALQPFSVRELLHHTAGLHSDEDDTARPAPAHSSQIDLARAIAAQPKPFDFEPGTAWLYSNANYVMLGAVVESVSGLSLADALATFVVRPLGLETASFDDAAAIVRGRASGYSAVEGKPGLFTNAAWIDVSEAGGAGAMRSSAEDLCRWHHALLSGRVLGKGALATMLAPGRLRDGRLSGANRFRAEDAHYGDVQYAAGLMVSPEGETHRTILHYGAINGFAGVLETHLERRVTIAILCNGDMNPGLPFRAMRRAVSAAAKYL
jgi:CubicO group peptidase (beta-lactamase class C family)